MYRCHKLSERVSVRNVQLLRPSGGHVGSPLMALVWTPQPTCARLANKLVDSGPIAPGCGHLGGLFARLCPALEQLPADPELLGAARPFHEQLRRRFNEGYMPYVGRE